MYTTLVVMIAKSKPTDPPEGMCVYVWLRQIS